MIKQPKIQKNQPSAPPWHLLEPWQTTAWLKVDPEKGLNHQEAKERLEIYGPNAIKEQSRRGPIRMFFGQFADFMIIVLILACIVSGLVGDLTDTIAIVVIIVLNAIIGFIQEYRAEKAVAALKRLSSPTAQVLREGENKIIAAHELVPGDLVMLEAGNVVPADLKLLDVARLKVEEAALTGESLPVEKSGALIRELDLPLGDRLNMAYKGIIATYGSGRRAGRAGHYATSAPSAPGKHLCAMHVAAHSVDRPVNGRRFLIRPRLGLFYRFSPLAEHDIHCTDPVANGARAGDQVGTGIVVQSGTVFQQAAFGCGTVDLRSANGGVVCAGLATHLQDRGFEP